jgi:dienelactone hydrolase
MKVCFVSGAYRSDDENEVFNNIIHARKVARMLWEEGYAVLCPHANSAFMGSAKLNDAFIEGDLELLRRSDVVCMIQGWEQSEGAKAEYALAVELGKAIIFEPQE